MRPDGEHQALEVICIGGGRVPDNISCQDSSEAPADAQSLPRAAYLERASYDNDLMLPKGQPCTRCF